MRILVCIKQVPGTAQVEIDPVTGTLKRDGVASKMNPYDLYALETALRFQQSNGAEVTVVTMGPPQAEKVLREAFMMGVDHAVLLSDRRFAGADVLATSYAISQGVKAAGQFDLIICGKQTTDGDTAQVGAEMAEFLGIPHVANVCKINSVDGDSISVDLDLPLHIETVKVKYPCLMTMEKGIFEPRLPSYKRKLATRDRKITVITLNEMRDKDPNHYGLNGSPTQVKRIFPPEHSTEQRILKGEPETLSAELYSLLEHHKILQQPR